MCKLKFFCLSSRKNDPAEGKVFMDQNDQNFVTPIRTVPKKKREPLCVSLPVCVLCVLLACLFVFMGTYVSLTLTMKRKVNEAYADAARYDKLLEIAELYREDYYYAFDSDEAADTLASMYGSAVGDRYYSYYTKEEWLLEYNASMGNAIGIGVYVVMTEDGLIQVARVMANTPASSAGLQDGDIITAVDGQKVAEIGYATAVDLVLGEVGTTVSFDVLRGEEMWEIDVTRGNYEPQTVFANVVTMSDGTEVGYIHIVQFEGTTPKQLIAAVEGLMAAGVKGLAFDVRDNPGGDLSAILQILDYLLPEGPLVHIVSKDESENETYYSDASEIDLPMVVLTNGHTASAAELFTSALKDYEKAETVGQQTYGKGCGQEGKVLSDGSVLFLTTFLYNPPFSENYDGIGIPADYVVSMNEKYENVNLFLIPPTEDTQLQAALNVLCDSID